MAGEERSRLDLSSVGQHQMPPPGETQVPYRSLLLSPVIKMRAHLGLQAAGSAL